MYSNLHAADTPHDTMATAIEQMHARVKHGTHGSLQICGRRVHLVQRTTGD